jgi:hypothetical protein
MIMGLFNGKKNEPDSRDPRPKGAQKGVTARAQQKSGFNFGGNARTPWLKSGSGVDKYDGKRRWRDK